MKIVIAPDSYKECLSAPEVARIVAEELRRCRPDVETVECPLSDGGEGFLEVVTAALGGCLVRAVVTGPMGERVEACFGRAGETGIIDAASASGLMRVPPERRNPLLATSLGTGELMVAAFRSGCRRLLIGLGGTATCDGGEGMMRAEGIDALRGRVEIEALCDVDNPFVGPRGAARVFAPQKGAGPEMVEMLEERMVARAGKMLEETGTDVARMPGAGAAGGLAGALVAYFGAKLVPGIDAVLRYVDFKGKAVGADFIITGEGKSDSQTLMGKVPFGVLRHSGGVPVLLLSGRIDDAQALLDAGFAAIAEVSPRDLPLREALRPEVAAENLRRAVSGRLKKCLYL